MRKCFMINTPFIFNAVWFVIKGLLAARYCDDVDHVITVCFQCMFYRYHVKQAEMPLQFSTVVALFLSNMNIQCTGRSRRCRCGAQATWTNCCRKSSTRICQVIKMIILILSLPTLFVMSPV